MAVDPTARSRHPGRVLVVERDDALRLSTRDVLSAAGFDVRVAPDVTGATASAATSCPDVVLVHVGLPDGWELVRALRADPRTCGCALVATGGRPVSAYASEPMLAEVEAYVQKPAEPDFLLAVLTGALSGGGVAERASREMPAAE